MHWGQDMLRSEYNSIYGCYISDWKIFLTIQKHNLYPDVKKITNQRNKSKSSVKKKKITDLKTKNQNILGHLLQIDTIVLHLFGFKRYILTAIDKFGKIAFARIYRNHSTQSAADFLQRLNYLLNNEIINIQTDNESEF
jgi:transposase-like protein